jgi:hypothetical protein
VLDTGVAVRGSGRASAGAGLAAKYAPEAARTEKSP